MVKGTGELGQGTSILTRLVKRPSGAGIEQRLEREEKEKSREKNAKAERYELVCSFLAKERPLWLTLNKGREDTTAGYFYIKEIS